MQLKLYVCMYVCMYVCTANSSSQINTLSASMYALTVRAALATRTKPLEVALRFNSSGPYTRETVIPANPAPIIV